MSVSESMAWKIDRCEVIGEAFRFIPCESRARMPCLYSEGYARTQKRSPGVSQLAATLDVTSRLVINQTTHRSPHIAPHKCFVTAGSRPHSPSLPSLNTTSTAANSSSLTPSRHAKLTATNSPNQPGKSPFPNGLAPQTLQNRCCTCFVPKV